MMIVMVIGTDYSATDSTAQNPNPSPQVIVMVIVMVLITMMIMLVLDKAPADSGPHPTHGDIRVKPCWASLPVFHQPGIDN